MGASAWSDVVYTPASAQEALVELQRQLLDTGRFYWDDDQGPRPISMAAMRRTVTEDGTHSALDVRFTSDDPYDLPLDASRLQAIIAVASERCHPGTADFYRTALSFVVSQGWISQQACDEAAAEMEKPQGDQVALFPAYWPIPRPRWWSRLLAVRAVPWSRSRLRKAFGTELPSYAQVNALGPMPTERGQAIWIRFHETLHGEELIGYYFAGITGD
ncbi:MAG: hypothetical protein AAFV53_21830 [Myxococcota bacterium]